MERTFNVKAASVALKALQLYPVTQKVQKLLKRWTSMLCDVDTPHDPAHDITMQCALAQQLECLQLSGKVGGMVPLLYIWSSVVWCSREKSTPNL